MKEQLAIWLFRDGGAWLLIGIPLFIFAIWWIIWSWNYTRDSREEIKRWKQEDSSKSSTTKSRNTENNGI